MSDDAFSNLKRPRYPIPDFVKKALLEHGLMEAYRSRPPTSRTITSDGSHAPNGRKPR